MILRKQVPNYFGVINFTSSRNDSIYDLEKWFEEIMLSNDRKRGMTILEYLDKYKNFGEK